MNVPLPAKGFTKMSSFVRTTSTEARELISTTPKPNEPLPASSMMPAWIEVRPEWMLSPVKVSLPGPTFVTAKRLRGVARF